MEYFHGVKDIQSLYSPQSFMFLLVFFWLWEECVNKDLEQYGLRIEYAYDWREKIRAQIANPTSRDNGIETVVVVVVLRNNVVDMA